MYKQIFDPLLSTLAQTLHSVTNSFKTDNLQLFFMILLLKLR